MIYKIVVEVSVKLFSCPQRADRVRVALSTGGIGSSGGGVDGGAGSGGGGSVNDLGGCGSASACGGGSIHGSGRGVDSPNCCFALWTHPSSVYAQGAE